MTAPQQPKVRRKVSVTIVTGFKCAVCDTETVTHDGSVAAVCLECDTPNPKQVWKNQVIDKTEVIIL